MQINILNQVFEIGHNSSPDLTALQIDVIATRILTIFKGEQQDQALAELLDILSGSAKDSDAKISLS